MTTKLISKLLVISFCAYLLLISGLISCFYWYDYAEILNWIQQHYAGIEERESFDHQLFTETHYQSVRQYVLLLSSSLLIGCAMVLIKFRSVVDQTVRVFHFVKKRFKTSGQLLSKLSITDRWYLGILLFFVIGFRLYYMELANYLADDETGSYTWFSSQGWIITLFHYPEPNNHVLYNLCSVFWLKLGVPDWLAIRLTSLLSYVGIILVSYLYFLRYSTPWVAKWVTTMIVLSFSASLYAGQGRGYLLLSFCAVCALFSLWRYLQNPSIWQWQYLFIGMSVAGFFAVPTFIFPYLTCCILVLLTSIQKTDYKLLISFSKYQLVSIVFVLLAYSPVLLASSPQALLGNKYIAPQGWLFLKENSWVLMEFLNYIVGIPSKSWFMILALVGVVFWIRNRLMTQEKKVLQLLFASGISLLLLIILTRSYPPHRAFTYLAYWFAISTGVVLARWTEKLYAAKATWGLLMVSILLVFGQHIWFQQTQPHYLRFMLSNRDFEDIQQAYKQLATNEVTNIYSANRYCFPCKHFRKDALLVGKELQWYHQANELQKADALILTDTVGIDLKPFRKMTVIKRKFLEPHYIYLRK